MNKIEWEYFEKFEEIVDKYMETQGEGETKASQAVTATNKLIYKWYNDGDVYDNTCDLTGWANDLSSYANWLAKYIEGARDILDEVFFAKNDDDYEMILKNLADTYLNEEALKQYETEAEGSIYECEGNYEFNEYEEPYEPSYEEW